MTLTTFKKTYTALASEGTSHLWRTCRSP